MKKNIVFGITVIGISVGIISPAVASATTNLVAPPSGGTYQEVPLNLTTTTGSASQTLGDPVGPRLDGLVINETSHLLKQESNGIFSGKIVQSPADQISSGPNAHGTFDIQSTSLISSVEADFDYKIEGTQYKVKLDNLIPTLGRHEIECSIVNDAGNSAPEAPFICKAVERNSGIPSLWNPRPQFTVTKTG